MKKRIIVGLMWLPIFFAMLFIAPMWMFGIFVGGMCAIGAGELLQACDNLSPIPRKKGYYFSTKSVAFFLSMGFALWQIDLTIISLSLVLVASLFTLAIFHFDESHSISYQSLFVCFFGGIVFPIFFSSLLILRQMDFGKIFVLLPMVITFSADTGAYFVGMTIGKHRGVTKVSPNKSLEGYIGGLVCGTVAAVVYAYVLQYFFVVQTNPLSFAVYGLFGSYMTALGDLSFSFIKRQTGIKDYGTLIAGHGGILDRFDGMTLSAPTIWLLLQLISPLTI